MTRVSVAMATYNGAAFLVEQLASIAAQSRPPDELVVGDDGSGDGTLACLADFAARAPFPVLVEVNRARLGVAGNFFATIGRCSGDLILLSDQDDVWRPDKLARVVAHFAGHPRCLMATHDATIVDGRGRSTGRTLGGQIAAAGGRPARDLVAGCCMAIDARLARAAQPPPLTETHDAWLAQLADLVGLRDHLDQSLIDYRRHGANVSHSYMSRSGRADRLARFLDRTRKARATPPRPALRASLASNAALRDALGRHRAMFAREAGREAVAAAEATLDARMERDSRRLRVHEAEGRARLPALAAAWRAGDYRGRDGALSLVRDLIG